MTPSERRQYARMPLKRRVKLMCTSSGRCFAGQTEDYSAGGCRVALDASGLEAGAQVKVAVDWTGRMGLAQAELMPSATVVRALQFDNQPQVALAFAQVQPLLASA